MANLNQILDELKNQVQAALTANAPTALTVLYRGWPVPEELQSDLRNMTTNISFVTKEVSGQRIDLPISPRGQETLPLITLTGAVSSSQLQGGTSTLAASATVTFGGTVTPSLNLLMQLGTLYVPYHPASTETPTTIAANYAAAINASPSNVSVIASASGTVLTVTYISVGVAGNDFAIALGVGGTGSISRQVRMEKDMVEIHIWSYDDDTRNTLGAAIDDYLSDQSFLRIDGEAPARLIYDHRTQADHEIHLGIYRRILHYTVQYSTVRTVPTYTILQGLTSVTSP